MMKITRMALLAGLLALVLPAYSRASVIDFEGYPDLTVFTTQDFGNGVTFSGAQILMLGGSLNPQFPPHSGVNVVYNPVGAMVLTFTNPVDFFSGYFTYNSGLVLTAYDSLNNVVATAIGACSANYVGFGCGSPNEFLQVTAIGLISSVNISGGGGNNFTLDDAEFTGSHNANAVPEPVTMSTMLIGLGSLICYGRRKRS